MYRTTCEVLQDTEVRTVRNITIYRNEDNNPEPHMEIQTHEWKGTKLDHAVDCVSVQTHNLLATLSVGALVKWLEGESVRKEFL